MPFNEALFWVGLTMAGTGAYFLVEGGTRRVISALLTIIGMLAVAYSVYVHEHPTAPRPATWIVLLIVTWLVLAYEIYSRQLTQRMAQRANEDPRAKLLIRFATTGAYRRTHGQRTHIRFGVYNDSDIAAENIEVFLTEIQPQPSWAAFDPDLPYRVRRADTGAEHGDHRLNPRHEELFDILWFWMSVPEGPGLMVDGIDTKRVLPTVPSFTKTDAALAMQPGEHWHMTYRISAANADEQRMAVFFVERVGDAVQATLVQAARVSNAGSVSSTIS
jgi:hypothetical protein